MQLCHNLNLIGQDKNTKHCMFLLVGEYQHWPLLLILPPGQTQAKSSVPYADCQPSNTTVSLIILIK